MHFGYFLRGNVTGLFKVGVSCNVRRRMSQYRTHTPERITVEAIKAFVSEEEALDWEAWVLESFNDCIVHGEWLDWDFSEAAVAWDMGMEPETNSRYWQEETPTSGTKVMAQWIELWPGCDYHIRVFQCDKRSTAARLVSYLKGRCERARWLPREITAETFRGILISDENAITLHATLKRELDHAVRAMRRDRCKVPPPEGWREMEDIDKLDWLCQFYPRAEWGIREDPETWGAD